ncbi:MAG: hypothetical protein JO256_14680 [Alphaproteobacteria bacterium]|nr:hypothetical protein [Alphaproteobacteria bacterium]
MALNPSSVPGGIAFPAAGGIRPEKLFRYGTSLVGTGMVSAIHFGLSYFSFRVLSASDFGLLSFAIVLSALCMSVAGALFGAPLSTHAANDDASRASLYTWSAAATCAAFFACSGLSLIAGASLLAAGLFGLYSAAMFLRATSRFSGYAQNAVNAVLASDLIYSAIVLAGLSALFCAGLLELPLFAAVLFAGAAGSTLVAAPDFLWAHIPALCRPQFSAYRQLWRRTTRWTLLGVVTSELSSNAYAYVVTFFAGAGAFGLLSLGAMLVRPINLVSKTLGDMELSKARTMISRGAKDEAAFLGKRLGFINAGVWMASALTTAFLLAFFPEILVRDHFDKLSVSLVAAIWFTIMLVRIARTSQSLLLQACGAFEPLARLGLTTSIISLTLSGALLWLMGPVGALFGILLSDIGFAARVAKLARIYASLPEAGCMEGQEHFGRRTRANRMLLKSLGKGWQHRTFDLENGRVCKRTRNVISLGLELLRAKPFDRPLQSSNLIAEILHLRRSTRHSLEELSRRRDDIPAALLGNPVYLADGSYEQDKVVTLRSYFDSHDIAEGKKVIDAYVAFVLTGWRLGFGDPGFDFALNNGVNSAGNIVQIDLGEISFSKDVIVEAVRKQHWLLQNSLARILTNPELKRHFEEQMAAKITVAAVHENWPAAG